MTYRLFGNRPLPETRAYSDLLLIGTLQRNVRGILMKYINEQNAYENVVC